MGIAAWICCYNENRPHSSHGGRTPDEIYATGKRALRAAA
ncbi:integrase core domain-containing protein [Camelimonas fluminis]|uniref:Integrase core domain-containing protein n=1 Tax=Camelimonas fluminis TaxID=1576911 RepID=A0ABV7UH62_9HYPH|nr:transposase [Camelimonas fluminis]